MTIELKQDGERLVLKSPYRADFPKDARALDGRWDKDNRVWTFPVSLKDGVIKAISRHYEVDIEQPVTETVVAIVTATADHSVEKGDVMLEGTVLASASGRDSGAKTGEGVVLMDGNIGSSGSMKYWQTDVAEGAQFRVKEFPVHLLESEHDGWSIVQEEQNPADRRDVLLAERSRLMARLAEIDLELGVRA